MDQEILNCGVEIPTQNYDSHRYGYVDRTLSRPPGGLLGRMTKKIIYEIKYGMRNAFYTLSDLATTSFMKRINIPGIKFAMDAKLTPPRL